MLDMYMQVMDTVRGGIHSGRSGGEWGSHLFALCTAWRSVILAGEWLAVRAADAPAAV